VIRLANNFNSFQRPTSNAQHPRKDSRAWALVVGRGLLDVRFDFSPVTNSFLPTAVGGGLTYNLAILAQFRITTTATTTTDDFPLLVIRSRRRGRPPISRKVTNSFSHGTPGGRLVYNFRLPDPVHAVVHGEPERDSCHRHPSLGRKCAKIIFRRDQDI